MLLLNWSHARGAAVVLGVLGLGGLRQTQPLDPNTRGGLAVLFVLLIAGPCLYWAWETGRDVLAAWRDDTPTETPEAEATETAPDDDRVPTP